MDTNTSVFGSQIENSSRPVNTTEIDANGELSFSCKSLKMLRSFHLNIFYVCSPLRKSDRMGRTFTILRYWKFNQLYCVHFIGFYIYEVPVGIIVLLSIFYGSISIIAVIGNSLVIWIVATTRQMQTVTNLFIANLALADVVIGMFVIPFQVFFSIQFHFHITFHSQYYNICSVCHHHSFIVLFDFKNIHIVLRLFGISVGISIYLM